MQKVKTFNRIYHSLEITSNTTQEELEEILGQQVIPIINQIGFGSQVTYQVIDDGLYYDLPIGNVIIRYQNDWFCISKRLYKSIFKEINK